MIESFTPGSAEDVARARRDTQAAMDAGIILPGTVVPFGTQVIEPGQQLYKLSAQKWAEGPDADDVLVQMRDRVIAEKRRDRPGAVNLMRYRDIGAHGALEIRNGTVHVASMSETARDHLLTYEQKDRRVMPSSSAGYLLSDMMPSARRERDINEWLADAPAEMQAKLRVRGPEGRRQVFAITTPRYNADGDLDKVCQMLLDWQTVGAKGSGLYDGEAWSIDLTWHSHLAPGESVVAGEVFAASVRVRGHDAKGGGIHVERRARNNRCLNFLILGEAGTGAYTTHARKNLKGWLYEQLAETFKALEGLTERWNDAYKAKLLGQDWDSPSDAFVKLVSMNFLTPPPGSGLSKAEYVERLTSNYYAARNDKQFYDGGAGYVSVADAVNAATRMHEQSWKSPWMVQHCEEEGSALLQEVRVYRAA